VCGAAALHIQCGRLNPLQPVFIDRLVGIVRAAHTNLFSLLTRNRGAACTPAHRRFSGSPSSPKNKKNVTGI
jgi:hypothetical protein